MRYGLGCDHAGFDLKEVLIAELSAAGHEVVNMGTDSAERAQFPAYANKVAQGVSEETLDAGVPVCGTGQGTRLAATKCPDVRAVTVCECHSARMARRRNDADVLCLGGHKGKSR